jgi:hypothetical protein
LKSQPKFSQCWDAAIFAKALFIKAVLSELFFTTAARPLLNDASLPFGQARLVRRFNLSRNARVTLFGGALNALAVENELIPVHPTSFIDCQSFMLLFLSSCSHAPVVKTPGMIRAAAAAGG